MRKIIFCVLITLGFFLTLLGGSRPDNTISQIELWKKQIELNRLYNDVDHILEKIIIGKWELVSEYWEKNYEIEIYNSGKAKMYKYNSDRTEVNTYEVLWSIDSNSIIISGEKPLKLKVKNIKLNYNKNRVGYKYSLIILFDEKTQLDTTYYNMSVAF